MNIYNRHWWRWQSALRYKIIISVFIMTVPLVGMLLYNNFYAIDVVRGQVSDSYKNMLTLYMNQMDAGLNDIDAYMHMLAGTGSGYGSDLIALEQAKTDSEYYSAKVYLFNKLSKDISLYDPLNAFFVYVGNREEYMAVTKGNEIAFEEQDAIQLHITNMIQSGDIPKGVSTIRWQYAQIGPDYYLINIVKEGNVYLGSWVKASHLLEPLSSLQIGEGGAVLLANKQGEPITNTDLLSENEIELQNNLNNYYLSGSAKKFLVVGAQSIRGEFNLVALIPDKHILAKLPYLQSIIWIITIASLFFIPIGLYSMRQAILVPLGQLLLAMKKVRSGDWSHRVGMVRTSNEFKLLGESFNSMMDEIETLRIHVFEEQLNKQREELQRLQLQVNPHFFLNTLNIVYNLAKVKNYELIQEMTLSLIHYFRFMFRSNTSFVKLKDELEHTRNYLRIQGLRFPGQLTWIIQAPDFITDFPVPPLIIQSFVENSIKHAVNMDEPVSISVQIDFLDEESDSRMKIIIKDTGKGFDVQLLKELQAGRSIENERGEHTGIWNVHRRLKLLYKDDVTIQYDNDKETGGAAVEIILPTNPAMEE